MKLTCSRFYNSIGGITITAALNTKYNKTSTYSSFEVISD